MGERLSQAFDIDAYSLHRSQVALKGLALQSQTRPFTTLMLSVLAGASV